MDLDNFKYNLSRLKKCDQYWDEMKPISGGRICGKCDKKIVDFSNMTFTDIAFFMAESKDPVCGFYLPEQLKQIKSAKNRFPFAIGMTALLTASTISKAEKVCDRTEQSTMGIKLPENGSIEAVAHKVNKVDTVYLIGSIQSFDTAKKINIPVSYATVIIKGSKIGVLTKDNGDFKLCYLPSNDSIKFSLVISSVGLETREIEISYNGQKQIELGTIILDKYKAELTEFWVTTKKRSRLNMFWRKITNPFRRQ
nr:carboxypeptidase-like regulatory domain-containing protein [uncultured Flavobacterium sp.]